MNYYLVVGKYSYRHVDGTIWENFYYDSYGAKFATVAKNQFKVDMQKEHDIIKWKNILVLDYRELPFLPDLIKQINNE